MRSILSLLLFAVALVKGNELLGYRSFGFGVQKLKQGLKRTVASGVDCGNVKEHYFTGAVVNNFAPIEKQQHWAGKGQRFWTNSEFFGGKGFPVFVFIGGEGQESCGRLSDRMYAYDLAKQHQALLVNVEHRFYGESYPTAGMSTQELGLLSSEQALADLARLIGHLKSYLDIQDSKVITIGGSYPGNLAAWFRLKYPSVTQGSIASSAPLWAKTNFYEYMEVVGNSIKYFSGASCYDAIEKAANHVTELVGSGAPGLQQLEQDFKLCSPIQSSLDLAVLLSDLMGNIQGTVQYNNEKANVMNVTNICETMTASKDPYKQFVELTALYRKANGQDCEDASWADTVAYLAATAKDPLNNGRPWTYQTCNEFGYYQTTDSQNQPFHAWTPINMNFSRAICAAAFDGWQADPQMSWTNQVYGGTRIGGTNIVFPSGSIDPWHALGVTNSSAPLAQSSEYPLFILGTAHCHDLYAPANSDPPSLTQARQIIAERVTEFLK